MPNETPQIATADGGVIGQSGITYDQSGNATGQVGLFTQSWTMNEYADGPLTQVLANPYLFALSMVEGADSAGNGTAHIPIDSTANDKAKSILNSKMWGTFANSHCSAVFASPQGIPNYSLQMIQKKQQMTNFYDIGDSGVGDLTVQTVTGGQVANPVTLAKYLTYGGANGATANMGYYNQTAIVLASGILCWPSPTCSQSHPEFTLAHELILHAYAGQPDNAVYGNAFFTQNGLWRAAGSTATITISTWMSTDCTCTPGNPAAPSCQPNTAQW